MRPKLPKLPKISKKAIKDILDRMPEEMERRRQDEEDRRCFRGKHAPPIGKCMVCGGTVVAEIRFAHSDLIGGPPGHAHIPYWACQDCGLMYQKAPNGERPVISKVERGDSRAERKR
jgi:hypothetical protein